MIFLKIWGNDGQYIIFRGVTFGTLIAAKNAQFRAEAYGLCGVFLKTWGYRGQHHLLRMTQFGDLIAAKNAPFGIISSHHQ